MDFRDIGEMASYFILTIYLSIYCIDCVRVILEVSRSKIPSDTFSAGNLILRAGESVLQTFINHCNSN